MPIDYYIYYRTDPAAHDLLLLELRRLQAALADRTGVCGRILRRADGGETWMEIYAGIEQPDVFELALQSLVDEHRLERFLAPGERRHTERFVECA